MPGEDRLVSIAQSHFEISKSQKSWAAKDGELSEVVFRCYQIFQSHAVLDDKKVFG